jgi:hypothetical protein
VTRGSKSSHAEKAAAATPDGDDTPWRVEGERPEPRKSSGEVAGMRPREQSLLLPGTGRASDRTLELVDVEVRRIVDECYDEALEQLRANRERLDKLALALLEIETLDEADAYRIAGIERARAPLPEEKVPAAAASAR